MALDLINKLSKSKFIPLIFKLITLVVFFILIETLLMDAILIFDLELKSKTAMLIIWGLWWPFLYITVIFFSRLWCGFLCPISLTSDLGNKLQKGIKVNYIRWSFIPYILFFIIVLIEQIFGLFVSVKFSFWFLITFLLISFVVGIIFRGNTFCRLICPIGTLLGVFSRLSLIGLRTDSQICSRCKHRSCLKNKENIICPMHNNIPYLTSSKECLICTNCIKSCKEDSPKLRLKNPSKEIMEKINYSVHESLFIIALFALAFIISESGTQLFRILVSGNSFPWPVLRTLDFLLSISFFCGLFLFFIYMISRIIKSSFMDLTKETGYLFLPLAFFVMFSAITFGYLKAWIPFHPQTILAGKYIFLGIGSIWSIFLISNYTPKDKRKKHVLTAKLILITFLSIILLIWSLVVISDSFKLMDIKIQQNVETGLANYTSYEVGMHNSQSDCWIVIEDMVFDMSKISNGHPGMFHCGQDSSALYSKNHGKNIRPQQMRFVIGNLVGNNTLIKANAIKR